MARNKVRRIDWSPDEWLSGTRGQLTMIELAVYDVVLNLIYSRGSACPDEAPYIAGHFAPEPRGHGHGRDWQTRHVRAALDRLIDLGKLRVSTTYQGRWLTNGRADIELGRAEGRIDSATKAGVASGVARRARAPSPHRGRTLGAPSSDAEASRANDLARTAVRNHQPSYESVTTIESEAARATGRVGDALPAARPTPKLDPRLEAAAKAARAKLLGRGSS